jgi:hypothetical protein
MAISSKALVYLHTPLKTNGGCFDVIYCYPEVNFQHPLGSEYKMIRLSGAVQADGTPDIYMVPFENIALIYYNADGNTAADSSVAFGASASLGFIDLTA